MLGARRAIAMITTPARLSKTARMRAARLSAGASGRSGLWAESLAVCIRLQVFPYRRSLPRAAVGGGGDIRTSPARRRFGLIAVRNSVNALRRPDRPPHKATPLAADSRGTLRAAARAGIHRATGECAPLTLPVRHAT